MINTWITFYTLESFLKSNNIKYVMFDSLWNKMKRKKKKFESKYRLIDFTKWVWGEGKLSWTETLLSIDPTNSETRVGEHDDHPNIKGHRIWSDLTINKIKSYMVDLIGKFSLLTQDEKQNIYNLVHGQNNVYQKNDLLILDNKSGKWLRMNTNK